MAYDELERVRRITNPRQETYDYEYDDVGRIVRETSFHGRTLRYSYSPSENVARINDNGESSRSFEYDLLGNLLADHAADGSRVFERDPLGRLKRATVTEASGKVCSRFELDALGRVMAERQGDLGLAFTYGPRGYRASRQLSNGATTQYRYDVSGLLASLEHDGQRVTLHRDELGREVHRRTEKGRVDIQSAYDACDRLTSRDVSAPRPGGYQATAWLSQRRWRYDPTGRVSGIDDARWGTTTYAHDRVGRLLSAARGAHREVFEYDTAGSLTNALADLGQVGRAAPWVTERGNLLVETPEATYENDGQGRRVTRLEKSTGQTTTYAWDSRDQLREVTTGDGRRMRYIYDAFGRRVRKEIVGGPAPSTTEFLWDGDVALRRVRLGAGAARIRTRPWKLRAGTSARTGSGLHLRERPPRDAQGAHRRGWARRLVGSPFGVGTGRRDMARPRSQTGRFDAIPDARPVPRRGNRTVLHEAQVFRRQGREVDQSGSAKNSKGAAIFSVGMEARRSMSIQLGSPRAHRMQRGRAQMRTYLAARPRSGRRRRMRGFRGVVSPIRCRR